MARLVDFLAPRESPRRIMDTPYTVLARRFRPQTFSEVVGQERIATTLRNAILEGRVAHAYLFTGARGVGKTSMARIFAKALNCPNAVDAVPCNDCEICRGISVGQDVDVSEIDGASNRGIDDIRMLRANVHVKSMRSKYKIYIIDEVHMLTKEAFNALLKTLEEPPPNVKFIFCTTEPNKVPDTILSRCQRFDFGAIATSEIVTRLDQLAKAEGFDVEPAALQLVARRAAGSMRDSQSLFDQLLSFGSEKITSEDVHRLFGTAPDDRLINLVQALIDRRRDLALNELHTALQSGVQIDPFTDQLVAYLRDLMVIAAGAATVPLMSVGSDRLPQLQAQAKRWGLQTIAAALQILAETKVRMQRVSFGRALVELALVRLSLLEDLEQLDTLIAQWKSGQAATVALAGDSPPAQKKNDDGPLAPESSPPAASQAPAPMKRVEFRPGNEGELLAALVEKMNDAVGTNLRRATRSAISGPNRLEIFLPASYDLALKACERPEVQSRIEAALRELTGQGVSVRFVLDGNNPAPSPPTRPMSEVRTRRVDDPEDILVKEVTEKLGIQGWRVQELPPVAAVNTDERE
jgi:DNA polymerase-3 subunit gamma/tau